MSHVYIVNRVGSGQKAHRGPVECGGEARVLVAEVTVVLGTKQKDMGGKGRG